MFPLQPEFQIARRQFAEFLEKISLQANHVALHDVDADGIAAGVLWQRLFERLNRNFQRFCPNRERNAWTESSRNLLKNAAPDALFILDLGSQSQPVLEGIPTCFIDHHQPEGVPPGDLLISGYAWNPIPNTSWMMWELAREMVEVEDLDWIAVIGTLSDLGEKAPWDKIGEVKKKYTAKYLKEATALVNAPRRASHFNPEAAAIALLNHQNPKDLVLSDAPEVEELRLARKEVAAALQEGKKAAPVFAGQAALIRVSSPCQIHPLIAQIWRSRLPKYFVICANDAYLPNRINFSARAMPGQNVLEFLRSFSIAEGEGNFGHGHDQASGGSLPPERWDELLEKMGFSEG